jgi:hypothetical protein
VRVSEVFRDEIKRFVMRNPFFPRNSLGDRFERLQVILNCHGPSFGHGPECVPTAIKSAQKGRS